MAANEETRRTLLARIDREWLSFRESYAGIPDTQLEQSGAIGDWSIKDIIAHVSIWEEEALHHLPTVAAGGSTPRYASVGGIDAFNARMIAERRVLPLGEVRQRAEETHNHLIAYLRAVPVELLTGQSRFRRRLRLDTYGHYPLHTAAIRAWRTK